jgi:hypothetical protein
MAEVTDYEQVARAEIEEVNRDAGNNPVIINDAVTRKVVDDARAVLGRTTRLR